MGSSWAVGWLLRLRKNTGFIAKPVGYYLGDNNMGEYFQHMIGPAIVVRLFNTAQVLE
jgi:hypothetical protein